MFRNLSAIRVTGIIFYASGHGSRKYCGRPEFFKKRYLSKFFVVKMKKILFIMSQKILYRLCVC